ARQSLALAIAWSFIAAKLNEFITCLRPLGRESSLPCLPQMSLADPELVINSKCPKILAAHLGARLRPIHVRHDLRCQERTVQHPFQVRLFEHRGRNVHVMVGKQREGLTRDEPIGRKHPDLPVAGVEPAKKAASSLARRYPRNLVVDGGPALLSAVTASVRFHEIAGENDSPLAWKRGAYLLRQEQIDGRAMNVEIPPVLAQLHGTVDR